MIDLSTTYLGLPLRTPLVASASPLSQDHAKHSLTGSRPCVSHHCHPDTHKPIVIPSNARDLGSCRSPGNPDSSSLRSSE